MCFECYSLLENKLLWEYKYINVIYCCFKKGLYNIDVRFIYLVEVRFLKMRYLGF